VPFNPESCPRSNIRALDFELLPQHFVRLSADVLVFLQDTRAFSLPCPLRSPPKRIHVRSFSSTPFSRRDRSCRRRVRCLHRRLWSNSASRTAPPLVLHPFARVRDPTTLSPSYAGSRRISTRMDAYDFSGAPARGGFRSNHHAIFSRIG